MRKHVWLCEPGSVGVSGVIVALVTEHVNMTRKREWWLCWRGRIWWWWRQAKPCFLHQSQGVEKERKYSKKGKCWVDIFFSATERAFVAQNKNVYDEDKLLPKILCTVGVKTLWKQEAHKHVIMTMIPQLVIFSIQLKRKKYILLYVLRTFVSLFFPLENKNGKIHTEWKRKKL